MKGGCRSEGQKIQSDPTFPRGNCHEWARGKLLLERGKVEVNGPAFLGGKEWVRGSCEAAASV